MNNIKVIFIYSSLVLLSCGSAKKIFTEKESFQNSTITFESEEFIVTASKDQLIKTAYEQLVKDVHHNEAKEALAQLQSKDFEEYRLPLELEGENSIDNLEVQYYLALFPALHQLIKIGQVKIFNNSKNVYEEVYQWKRIEDKLGTVTDVFTLEDGQEILNIPVKLGE